MELRKVLKRLLVEVMGKRRYIYFTAMAMIAIFSSAYLIIGSFLTKRLFTMAQQKTAEGLWQLVAVNLGLCMVCMLLSIVATVIYNDEAKRAIARINELVYMKSVRLPMTYYETHHTGEVMSKLMYDAQKTGDVFGSQLRRMLMPMLMVVLFLVPMIYLSPQVTIALLAVHFMTLVLNTQLVGAMKKVSKELSGANKEMSEGITNILQGIETIKMFDVKQEILERYDIANDKISRGEKKKNSYGALLTAINTASDLLCSLVFLGMGIYFVEKGIVDIGSLAAIYMLYGCFSWNFLQIGRYIPNLVNCLTNAQRVFEFIDQAEEPVTYGQERELGKEKIEEQKVQAFVSMENITFGYPGSNKKVLEDFSLTVEKGTSVAITGHSGRGKSTLAKLLLGFYPAEAGQIYIGGKSLQSLGLEKLRSQIAYVPQEPYLYDISIEENIALGRPSATKEEIIEAAKAANAHDFIMKQPEGYGAMAGERGAKLSGGEKQRIAIARAILKNAPILLLDEATSALDNESEHLVQEAIGQMMKDRTTIMIAHRPSTIATADVVIKM